VIICDTKTTIELLVIITSVLFDQTYSEVEAKAQRGSNGFMYTSSHIRTPYFSTHSGYSYGPYQVTKRYSYTSHLNHPYPHKKPHTYNNFFSPQYKNQYHCPYDAKPYVKFAISPNVIKTEIFKTAKVSVVQEPGQAPIPTAVQTSLRRPVIQTPVQTPVVQKPVHRLAVQTPAQTPVYRPVVQEPVQTPVVQTHVRTPVTQEPIELPEALPLLNLRPRVTTTRTTTKTAQRPTTMFSKTRPTTTTTTTTTTEFRLPRTKTMTTTTTAATTTTAMRRTTTTTTQEEDDDIVLDFSSGKAEEVRNTASTPAPAAPSIGATNTFSKFRKLIDAVGVNDLLKKTGNVTIFSPINKAFEELPTKVEDVPVSTIRRWILKHFVKGFLFSRNMVNGPLETLGGEFLTVSKDPETNKVRIFSLSGQANVKVSNIKTKFGLVHAIDTVLT